MYTSGGKVRSFKKSSITLFIYEDVIVIFDDCLDESEASEPTRGKDQATSIVEFSYLFSELGKILGCSEGEGTSSRVDSELCSSFYACFDGEGVVCQSEIIVGCKVESLVGFSLRIYNSSLC